MLSGVIARSDGGGGMRRGIAHVTWWAVGLAVSLVFAAAGLAGTAQGDASEPLLKVASTAAVTTWDPVKSFSTEVLYMANLYEPLIYANPPGSRKRFRPALATSWKRSPDAKTWTFRRRQGVTFHNGEPLTAAAVKGSVEAAAKRGGASFIWAPLDTCWRATATASS